MMSGTKGTPIGGETISWENEAIRCHVALQSATETMTLRDISVESSRGVTIVVVVIVRSSIHKWAPRVISLSGVKDQTSLSLSVIVAVETRKSSVLLSWLKLLV